MGFQVVNNNDPDRCTGRTHKMLLRVLARCGDPNVKNHVVVSHYRQHAHNLFVAFCRIAEADPFCTVTNLNGHKVTVNGTVVWFISVFEDPSGFPMNCAWEEDHEVDNATMTLRQFRRYESVRALCSRQPT